MPGRYLSLIWPSEPTLDAPAKYRRACTYEPFVPDLLSGLPLHLEATLAGMVSEAEESIRSTRATPSPHRVDRLIEDRRDAARRARTGAR
jgi:hypothetical protein